MTWPAPRTTSPTGFRIAVLAVSAAMVVACSHSQLSPTPSASSSSTVRAAPSSQPPPGPGATPAALAAWIAAGKSADPAAFRTVTLRGTVKTLDGPTAVAFRLPGPHKTHDVAGCVSQLSPSPALTCLPPLKNPPKKPDAPGQWLGNWVTFDGASITVGSFHGDPGPFNDGSGEPLNYGETITFGDYQCRSDPTGMYCISRSHHSGLAMSSSVTTYGCVQLRTHDRFFGEQFTCS